MKFGKRLASEAARQWRSAYVDYKAIKRAIQVDVKTRDSSGASFDTALRQELQKINAFYCKQEQQAEGMLTAISQGRRPAAQLAQFRAELTDLRKFVVLNYIAVIKAVKKRNRHLKAACGATQVASVRATQLLSQQHFFTSPSVALLATRAEVLANELGQDGSSGPHALEDYQCAICLGTLHSPVVLTCAHRFCWGCLVAHCATIARGGTEDSSTWAEAKQAKPQQHERTAAIVAGEADGPSVATYDCPVCRKAQILDLDRLQVDVSLSRYIEQLQLKQAGSAQQQQQAGGVTGPLPPASAPEALTLSLSTAAQRQHQQAVASLQAVAAAEGQPAGHAPGGTSVQAALEQSASASIGPAGQQRRKAADAAAVALPQGAAKPPLAPRPAPTPTPSNSRQTPVMAVPTAVPSQPLLPPQRPEHQGLLTVVLDLDGTLISSFTPRRAPRPPPGITSYVVGRGGRLNPGGVFILERPGLQDFFERLSQFAEVVLFTAGLEDYASPIVDALDANYKKCFGGRRLYRPATMSCDLYPCIKDLSMLGRPLWRTVLVDDTPLAFLRQPDNGVPVLGFRGDVDDRMLSEAILPLLESLQDVEDVRPVLRRRFNMPRWFRAQGVPVPETDPCAGGGRPATQLLPAKRRLPLPPGTWRAEERGRRGGEHTATLLLCDFDKSLTDCDAGETLVGELAPELAPMLASLEMPANFVPLTNAVLSEMARRGVARDHLLAALRRIGQEMLPSPSVGMLQMAHQRGVDVSVLSDCNTVFINHMLTGAKVHSLVKEIITNAASFQQVEAGSGASAAWTEQASEDSGIVRAASQRLVIQPRVDFERESHGCPLCPANLCKGQEVEALRAALPYQRIIYCGDGANDLCPALALWESDVVLARRGHALEKLLAERRQLDEDDNDRVLAQVIIWRDHSHLLQLVEQLL